MKLNLPYLRADKDRHGNDRMYVRRKGRNVRMTEKPGTQAFMVAYTAAVDELGARRGKTSALPIVAHGAGTLGWLGAQYFDSAEFKRLASQRTRRLILEECFREPRTKTDPDPIGNCPLAHVGPSTVRMLRDRKADLPGAANNRRKYLSSLFGWAVEAGHMKSNPARDVRRVSYASSGFHTWTVEEVEQFAKRHPLGTKAGLALALLMFTGVRRGDLVTLGKQHVRDGWLRFVPRKTRHKRATLSEKPLLPALAEAIAASHCGDLTFLMTEYGRSFTAAGFGGWFRKRCDEAGLPQCSAHGLRKAGATLSAENGATVHQLMSCFDWTTISQAQKYIEAANRKRLAAEGMPLLGRTRT